MTAADAEIIQAALRSCTTSQQVKSRWGNFWGVVQDMKADPVMYVHALHCKNLADYMLLRIEQGWGPLVVGTPEEELVAEVPPPPKPKPAASPVSRDLFSEAAE